jgi:tetratricopeptide (TPR) repeat protein
MPRMQSELRSVLLLFFCTVVSSFARAQGDGAAPPRSQGAPPSKDAVRMGSPPGLPPGTTVETMWPAPTAEDWKKPCLIVWQRTWDDALRVAQATGKPILVAVNMDGEPASEHFAGIRYRNPETARLFDPYVCVVASVYRHTPRDYDASGQRIPCPRFGTVTCGEHIAMESLLYDKFFDGKRVAPRHIAVEFDSRMMYDVYFSWDTQTVFTALVEGVKDRPPSPPIVRDDMPIIDRTASPDVVDRIAVETEYRHGTPQVRRALIEAAMTHKDVDPVELLRLAIFGLDMDLARLARRALAQCDSEGAVDLIAEALKVPMADDERQALLAAVVRLAEKYPRARTLAAVQQGLAKSSQWIDVNGWSKTIESETNASARTAYERSSNLEVRATAAEAHPEDANARLALAESFLSRAQDERTEKRFSDLFLTDARNAALSAEKLGAKGWRLDALLAVTSVSREDRDAARAHAVAAIEGGMPRPDFAAQGGGAQDAGVHEAGAQSVSDRTAIAVLALFAEARQRAIAKAYHDKAKWPPEWLADIHAAYSVLVHHPLGTDANVASYYDFLRWLGATPRANDVLSEGLGRFPASAILHDRLRARVLWEKGPDGLEATYAAMLDKDGATRDLEWFAGYASLVAAEHDRRSGEIEKALAAYDRGIAHYERCIEKNPDGKNNATHYIALARAGRARIALERGDLELATSEILAAFEIRPYSAASPDGLNITPVQTAQMLRSRLAEAGREDLLARLQAGLDALDPSLLELPLYEREIPPERPRRTAPAQRSTRDR